MTDIPDKPYFTASEVAAMLLVSTNSVRVWANKGLLKTEWTLGGHRRFARSEIERLVQERKTAEPKPASAPQALRILIIDDEVDLANTLAQGLEQALPGCSVTVAGDGFSGGLLARSADPHIILLDLRMPGVDGCQTCKMLKADAATRHIRIIAISGFLSSLDSQRMLDVGAERVLAKPLRIPNLLAALQ
jgi:CheY-like chemotaxis protein